MENKKIIIIVLAVVVLSLVAVLIWSLFFRQQSQPELTETPDTVIDDVQIIAPDNLPPAQNPRIEVEQNYLLGVRPLAMSFAERFGSYSSQAGYEHIADLQLVMTPNMRQTINNSYFQDNLNSQIYDGYQTKALRAEILSFNDREASIVVDTQRLHYREDRQEPEIFYQSIELKLLKFGEEWRVDQARWQS